MKTPSPTIHPSGLPRPSSCPLELYASPRTVAEIRRIQNADFHRRVCERLEYVLVQQQRREYWEAVWSRTGTASPAHQSETKAESFCAYYARQSRKRRRSSSPSSTARDPDRKVVEGYAWTTHIPPPLDPAHFCNMEEDLSWREEI